MVGSEADELETPTERIVHQGDAPVCCIHGADQVHVPRHLEHLTGRQLDFLITIFKQVEQLASSRSIAALLWLHCRS
jgi:hypothetical protein